MSKLIVFAVVASSALLMGSTDPGEQIRWMTWDEAVEKNKNNPKKIFVDIYTEWCGWCKRMDQTTFKDPEVIRYMNEHFYAIKLDAEMKKKIRFRDQEFKWVSAGRRGVHTLAYSLLEGRMSYPSFVTMTETFDRIAIMPGYKKSEQLIKELRFAAEDKFKETSWEDFNRG